MPFLLHPSQSSARDHRVQQSSAQRRCGSNRWCFYTVRRVVANIFNAFGANVITSVNFKLKYATCYAATAGIAAFRASLASSSVAKTKLCFSKRWDLDSLNPRFFVIEPSVITSGFYIIISELLNRLDVARHTTIREARTPKTASLVKCSPSKYSAVTRFS